MGKNYMDSEVQNWFNNGLLLSERIICLEEDARDTEDNVIRINHLSRFIKSMRLLETIDSKSPITILVSTPGGCEYSGFGIYDRILESPCHVTVRCYGQVMSIGALIMQAADDRQISPNCTMMIHDGYTTVVDASPKSLKAWADYGVVQCKKFHTILLDKMKRKDPDMSIVKIQNMCKDDCVIDADKAIELGLADRVFEGKDEE